MYQILFWLLTSICAVIIIGIGLTAGMIDPFIYWLFVVSGSLIFIVSQIAIIYMYRSIKLESKDRLRLLFNARKELNSKRNSLEHSKNNLKLSIELIEYMGKIARGDEVKRFPVDLCDRTIGDLYYFDAQSVKYLWNRHAAKRNIIN
jgi:hypothetical protein